MNKYLVAFFLFGPVHSFANVSIQSGYLIVNGHSVTHLEHHGDEVLVACEQLCVLEVKGHIYRISSPIFGKLSSVLKFLEQQELQEQKNKQASALQASMPTNQMPESDDESEKSNEESETEIPETMVTKNEASMSVVVSRGLPYPKPGTVFLYENGGRIVVRPTKECLNSCELVVLKDNQIVKTQKFTTKENAYVYLDINIEALGSYSWRFTDGSTVYNGQFVVQKNTSESFSRALASGQAIEVL